MTLLMGAFLSGSLAALIMPFLAFASVLLATIVVGSALVGFRDGVSFGIIVSAFILLLSGQLGFGISLLTRAHIVSASRPTLKNRERPAPDARSLWPKRRDRAT